MTKLIVVVAALAAARSWLGAAPPGFDVASIKPGQPGNEAIQTSPGTVSMRNVTLISCLAWAYRVQRYQIAASGAGLGWVRSDRYDIVAKAAAPAPEDQLRLMLQALLADRFHVAIQRENRSVSIFALVASKGGPKFHRSEGEGKLELKPLPAGVAARFATMEDLANLLAGRVENPVIDQTGLTGQYDFTIDVSSFVGDPAKPGPAQDMAAVLVTALQEQLGLRLETKKGPVEMLLIQRAAKPAAN